MNRKHLHLWVPDEWTNDQKGDFYEKFVADLLRPMRFKIVSRLRFTGMEIDLLARGEDQPRTILVECKAQRDPLPADVISKLLGNVALRRADAGWLFSTSDLSKDGKGQWEEIQANEHLVRQFTWYSPERTIDVLTGQRLIVDPVSLSHHLETSSIGDWTLIVTPERLAWLVQLVEDGIPTRFSVFDATTGSPFPLSAAQQVASLSARFSSLTPFEIRQENTIHPFPSASLLPRGLVARVISGDTWEDPRPARPVDFVGRDDIIDDIATFIDQARRGDISTRTFAIQGPSGWGKSSLLLKLSDLAGKSKFARCSLTAIDSRSATNSAFVSEAIRVAFADSVRHGILIKGEFQVRSLRDPLDSPDLIEGLEKLQASQSCIVLIFDQFEELFSKEELFETFNAIRELSLDIDARQVPLILGFAWKTDVSLPQLHPAYHLWHQLGDRRRSFKIREFGARDIQKIVSKAESALGKKLSAALKARLVEQCQGLPWLLKKLLVHVLQRVSTVESQYLLLERELDVELLFKEDLSVLGEDHIRCLKFVAARAPVAVSEVEENFARETTNLLINSNLLVRSGMNYVVYWDIFRDYLLEERVPLIPWARTFQRGPVIAIKALHKLAEMGSATVAVLAPAIGLKEGPCFNLVGDLVALQLVDSNMTGLHKPAGHLQNLDLLTIANYVQGQLRRHIVVRELITRLEKEKTIDLETWHTLFERADPRASAFAKTTVHQYANNLRGWLSFSGIIELEGKLICRPTPYSRQTGLLTASKAVTGVFLGTAAPSTFVRLLRRLKENSNPISRSQLEAEGLRNAVTDGLTLGIIVVSPDGLIGLADNTPDFADIVAKAKELVLDQTATKIVEEARTQHINDIVAVGQLLEKALGADWKPASARRYASGMRRYHRWAKNDAQQGHLGL